MLDFIKFDTRKLKSGVVEISPDFIVKRSHDLMVRGKSFYAIWDEEKGLWSTDEYDVQRLVDSELLQYFEQVSTHSDDTYSVKFLNDFSSSLWVKFDNYISHLADNSHQLDEKIAFANSEISKEDYISKKLPYSLEEGDCDAFKELIERLYDEDERKKIIWSIGAVISGDAKDIQKFLVFYGEAGTGKSTILNIIQKLFQGYYITFEAKSLVSFNNQFATEVFRNNPLVAIQHDGDLSRVDDNSKLNSLISHEEMNMNEKYKAPYSFRPNTFLFMATNKPVKITDAKSGLIRRLIDVHPSGKKFSAKEYQYLMSRIDFELGAIAKYCLDTYLSMGKHYYDGYRSLEMISTTDYFYNFVSDEYEFFLKNYYMPLTTAYTRYKEYCVETGVEYVMNRIAFKNELGNYYEEFRDRYHPEKGKHYRNVFLGFRKEKFESYETLKEPEAYSLVMEEALSCFDQEFENCPAQYATKSEIPGQKWEKVKSTLSELDTTKLHYVKVPENLIVIDFDITDSDGNKDPEANLAEASKWPPTYSEYSKSGGGIHLHYYYDGDVKQLQKLFAPGIEVKTFTGGASLRRKLSLCNSTPIAHIYSGLPLKEEKVINADSVRSEKALRELIERNLRKDIHPGTKPSVDFIYKILEDAYCSDLHYDVSDMRPRVMAFANNSTHHADYCLKLVAQMHFASKEISDTKDSEEDIIFFDTEVFPNLFILCWKIAGEDRTIVNMINPKPEEVEDLFKYRLVGFNNRRYDNHILYARAMGYSNEELYKLSQKIITNSPNATFGEAYGLSYADIYDFSSKKQSLKKFEIELGIHHSELGLPWGQPVEEKMIPEVIKYCNYDVIATEAVFNARHADFEARQILAELSGLSVNDTTQKHTAKIIFGNDRKASDKFVYTDLSEMFPGYKFEAGASFYRGENPGEGGYVYSEPGIYHNVALLDVASMHPTSIEQLNLFGPYTKNFSDLKKARIAIKHHDREALSKVLDGKLVKYLNDAEEADKLAYALKIAINIVYGLTSASFENPFRDIRNVDNIVAKRGALFMIDLKNYVQDLGYTVAHIKTDSIKIPDADPDIIEKVIDFGKKYGYDFEHEATYERVALVNDAVYIAKNDNDGRWEAVGAQFQHPYVFKKLFSKEEITFDDYCETKSVATALYLDFGTEDEPNYIFVGKVGRFVPVNPGCRGGRLLREKDGKYYSATGTKGYEWKEAETVKQLELFDQINMSYFDKLADDAVETIEQFGSFEEFVKE